MRVLIVDHYYDTVIDRIYGRNPGLGQADFVTQRARIDEELFGETTFEVAALRALGHEAWDCLLNIRPLQEAWAREHGMRLRRASRWGFRRRGGWLPWPRRPHEGWMGEALLSQVRRLKPDVVHIQAMGYLEPELVTAVRRETRFVVGQVATELPPERSHRGYDLVVSSIPDLVDNVRADGGDAAWLPLAFEPDLLDVIPAVERDVAVSFVGSFSSRYVNRAEIVEAVARATPLQTWTADSAQLSEDSPIRPTIQGAAFGRDMYEVLARSRLTINSHGRVAGNAANNLRLFEATGMGALLVTDVRSNLGQLFEIGAEVVTYSSAQECADVVRSFLAHPAEAEAIAAAGQRRTLRDHTWRNRMEQLIELVRRRL